MNSHTDTKRCLSGRNKDRPRCSQAYSELGDKERYANPGIVGNKVYSTGIVKNPTVTLFLVSIHLSYFFSAMQSTVAAVFGSSRFY